MTLVHGTRGEMEADTGSRGPVSIGWIIELDGSHAGPWLDDRRSLYDAEVSEE